MEQGESQEVLERSHPCAKAGLFCPRPRWTAPPVRVHGTQDTGGVTRVRSKLLPIAILSRWPHKWPCSIISSSALAIGAKVLAHPGDSRIPREASKIPISREQKAYTMLQSPGCGGTPPRAPRQGWPVGQAWSRDKGEMREEGRRNGEVNRGESEISVLCQALEWAIHLPGCLEGTFITVSLHLNCLFIIWLF